MTLGGCRKRGKTWTGPPTRPLVELRADPDPEVMWASVVAGWCRAEEGGEGRTV